MLEQKLLKIGKSKAVWAKTVIFKKAGEHELVNMNDFHLRMSDDDRTVLCPISQV